MDTEQTISLTIGLIFITLKAVHEISQAKQHAKVYKYLKARNDYLRFKLDHLKRTTAIAQPRQPNWYVVIDINN